MVREARKQGENPAFGLRASLFFHGNAAPTDFFEKGNSKCIWDLRRSHRLTGPGMGCWIPTEIQERDLIGPRMWDYWRVRGKPTVVKIKRNSSSAPANQRAFR